MALKKCGECGGQVSSEAKSCPHCGAKRRKSVGPVGIMVVCGLGILFVSAAIDEPSPPPTLTAEERAAKEADDARFNLAFAVAKGIKTTLREPDSMKLEGLWTNEKADLACIEYRAKNGFGGMNLERVVFYNKQLTKDEGVWNRRCAGKDLHDMSRVRFAI